jgi:hypothetical protein
MPVKIESLDFRDSPAGQLGFIYILTLKLRIDVRASFDEGLVKYRKPTVVLQEAR